MNKIEFIDLPSEETPINAENLNQMQDNIEQAIAVEGVAGDTLPIGSVVEFASDAVIPENWLLCNGQEVSRTEYNLLFAIIGTTWGEGDGSTTFNVPTKEGLVTVGKTLADSDFNFLGKTGGEKTHTLTRDELPAHSHAVNVTTSTREGTDSIGIQQRQSSSYSSNTVPERTLSNNYNGIEVSGGGDQPHNILQPYVTSNFIIKARQSSGVVATVVDGLDSDSATDALSAKQGKELNNKIDGIIESGEIDNWNYIKYADGTMIQTQRFTTTRDVKTQEGSLYWGYIEGYTDFAIPFTQLDNVQIYGENAYIFSLMSRGSTLTVPADRMYAFSPSPGTYDITVNIYAIGRWK